jgi:hypothetical protein
MSTAMIAKDKARTFLVAHRGRTFCDPCLARAVGIDPSTGHRAATRIARAGEFIREYGVCSGCGESRLVTHARGADGETLAEVRPARQ